MTAHPFNCEGCGASLPSADAVCARCEAELTAEPARAPAKYVCPHCQERIAAPVQVLWPPKVPWWRPTTMRLQCPRCDTPLRDRHWSQEAHALFVLAMCAAIGVQSATANRYRGIWVPLILIAYGLWLFSRHREGTRDPYRYVVGTRRRWLRDVRELWRNVRP